MEPAEPQAKDPQAGTGEPAADQKGHRLGQDKVQEQFQDTIHEFEEAMLALEQQEDDKDSDSGAKSDSEDEPMGEELLQILDEILTSQEAAKTPEEEPVQEDMPSTCHAL